MKKVCCYSQNELESGNYCYKQPTFGVQSARTRRAVLYGDNTFEAKAGALCLAQTEHDPIVLHNKNLRK